MQTLNNKRDNQYSLSQIEEENMNSFLPNLKQAKITTQGQQYGTITKSKGNPNDSALQDILDARKYLHQFLDKIGNKKFQKVNKAELKDILKVQFEPIQTYENFINLYENDIQKMVTNRQTKKNWNKDDILLLVWIVQKYCCFKNIKLKNINENDWSEIAQIMPGKSEDSCKFKWLSMKKTNVSLSPWTQQEDIVLQRIVEEKGAQWVEVSKILFEEMQKVQKDNTVYRTSKQCREHYNNFLDPSLKRTKWTEEEDQLLLKLQAELGNKWSIISRSIPGRTDNSVKNRFMTIRNKPGSQYQGSSGHNNMDNEDITPPLDSQLNQITEFLDDEEDDPNKFGMYDNNNGEFIITKEEEPQNESSDEFKRQQSQSKRKKGVKEINIQKSNRVKFENQDESSSFSPEKDQFNSDYLPNNNNNNNQQQQIQSQYKQINPSLFQENGQKNIFQTEDNLVKQISQMEISPLINSKDNIISNNNNNNANFLFPAYIDTKTKQIHLIEEQGTWFEEKFDIKEFTFTTQPLSASQKQHLSQKNPNNNNTNNKKPLNSALRKNNNLNSENSVHYYPEQYQAEYQPQQNNNNNNNFPVPVSPQKNQNSIFQQIQNKQVVRLHPVEQMMVGFPIRSFEHIMDEEKTPKNRFSMFQAPSDAIISQKDSNQPQNNNNNNNNNPNNNNNNNRNSLWYLDASTPTQNIHNPLGTSNNNSNPKQKQQQQQQQQQQYQSQQSQVLNFPNQNMNGPLGSPMHQFFNKSPKQSISNIQNFGTKGSQLEFGSLNQFSSPMIKMMGNSDMYSPLQPNHNNNNGNGTPNGNNQDANKYFMDSYYNSVMNNFSNNNNNDQQQQQQPQALKSNAQQNVLKLFRQNSNISDQSGMTADFNNQMSPNAMENQPNQILNGQANATMFKKQSSKLQDAQQQQDFQQNNQYDNNQNSTNNFNSVFNVEKQ